MSVLYSLHNFKYFQKMRALFMGNIAYNANNFNANNVA